MIVELEENNRAYTTGEMAKILQVSERTVCKWFDKGYMGGHRELKSRRRRLTRKSLVKFMEQYGMYEFLGDNIFYVQNNQ